MRLAGCECGFPTPSDAALQHALSIDITGIIMPVNIMIERFPRIDCLPHKNGLERMRKSHLNIVSLTIYALVVCAAIGPASFERAFSWSSNVLAAEKPRLVLPKVVKDWLAQHPAETTDADQPAGDANILDVTKHEDTESTGYDTRDDTYLIPTYGQFRYLDVVAKTDDVIVKKITVNRGNCKLYSFADFPATLKFGEKMVSRVDCDPLEVIVKTDKGVFAYNWDN